MVHLMSYLRNRRQLVKLGDKQSNIANVPHGIPQGSILGPLLFIVFINDLPFHVTSSTIDLYADDTTLTSCANYSSTDRLEQNLNSSVAEIAEWAAINKQYRSMKAKPKLYSLLAGVSSQRSITRSTSFSGSLILPP